MSILQHRRKAFRGPGTFVTSHTLAAYRHDFGSQVGFRFTVGALPLTVTHLGRWIVAGNSGQHLLGLYNNAGTALITNGSATLDTVGKTPSDYAYVALATPVVLAAGTGYNMWTTEVNLGDYWYNVVLPVTTTFVATINFASYFFSGVSNDAGAGEMFGPVNFKYQ